MRTTNRSTDRRGEIQHVAAHRGGAVSKLGQSATDRRADGGRSPRTRRGPPHNRRADDSRRTGFLRREGLLTGRTESMIKSNLKWRNDFSVSPFPQKMVPASGEESAIASQAYHLIGAKPSPVPG